MTWDLPQCIDQDMSADTPFVTLTPPAIVISFLEVDELMLGFLVFEFCFWIVVNTIYDTPSLGLCLVEHSLTSINNASTNIWAGSRI